MFVVVIVKSFGTHLFVVITVKYFGTSGLSKFMTDQRLVLILKSSPELR
jgi:hypothetical protein